MYKKLATNDFGKYLELNVATPAHWKAHKPMNRIKSYTERFIRQQSIDKGS